MLSDEEKKAVVYLKSYCINDVLYDNKHYEQIETVLNLIEKQQKEIEELKKENLEIRDWKYVIDSPIDLDKLKELDLIKIKGKVYISEDKIKAKIEEYREQIEELKDLNIFTYTEYEGAIKFGQSLLEKE